MPSAQKPALGLIFGGPGPEHGVSCLSARAIQRAVDGDRWNPVAIAWAPQGGFFVGSDVESMVDWNDDPRECRVSGTGDSVDPGDWPVDLAFPMVHGIGGEDGRLQGVLETAGIPYIGAGIQTCVLAWHKGLCKTVLATAGIPVSAWTQLRRGTSFGDNLDKVDYPVYIKPATGGSSVGVTRAHDDESFFEGLETAWIDSRDILIEPEIRGRELECGLLAGEAGPVGEIVKDDAFYSYEAKYLAGSGARAEVNPDLPPEVAEQARALALAAARVLGCESFCRVDMFYEEASGGLCVNEVNTHPGFTDISMYPKLWEHAGLSMTALIDRLAETAAPAISVRG